MTKEEAQKKRTILARIRESKLNRLLIKCAAGMALSMSASASNTSSEISNNFKEGIKKEIMMSKTFATDYLGMVVENMDVQKEAEKRAEWLLERFVDSMHDQLDVAKGKRGRQHDQLVKKFVNTVCPGSYTKGINYCIAAINYNMINLSENFPEFEYFKPDLQQYNGLSCRGYIASMRKSNPDCVVESKNLTNSLVDENGNARYEKGTIIFVRNSHGLHALTFDGLDEKGKPKVISFNRDGKGLLSNYGKSGFIVNSKKVIADNLVRASKNNDLMKWLMSLYSGGREDELVHRMVNLELSKGARTDSVNIANLVINNMQRHRGS